MLHAYQTPTTLQQEQHIISLSLESNLGKCWNIKCVKVTRGTMLVMMTDQKLMGHVKNYSPKCQGGYGYMFLWFCPIHGHCYGFHIIAGGEGCKDPFSSLYKYCETMPEDIYYDCACQLSEYCLNREPELFKNTQFWHDLFHLVGHVCGINFKSGRALGLKGVNTEICE